MTRIISRTTVPADWDMDGDGCLIWRGHKLVRNGYGQVNINENGRWKVWLVHRRVFFEYHGWLPEAVMHHCDKPACARISCLVPGTQADNMADMNRKGRQATAATPGFAKITDLQVVELRATYAAGGISQRALAARYGVSQGLVGRIVLGKERKTVSVCV